MTIPIENGMLRSIAASYEDRTTLSFSHTGPSAAVAALGWVPGLTVASNFPPVCTQAVEGRVPSHSPGGPVAQTHTQRGREGGNWTPSSAANSAANPLCAFGLIAPLPALGLSFLICVVGCYGLQERPPPDSSPQTLQSSGVKSAPPVEIYREPQMQFLNF